MIRLGGDSHEQKMEAANQLIADGGRDGSFRMGERPEKRDLAGG